jgi:hypothetical protein
MATKKITIPVYSDPGHAWFKVSKSLLKELGIESQITNYSYKRGNFAYLEEDCDATTLVNALDSHGIKYKVKEFPSNKQSKIRSYDSFIHNRF